jgi:hypothetical protein
MALFTTSKPKISVKSLAKFPVRVTASDGVGVTKANGVYTFTLDYASLESNVAISDGSEWVTAIYNSATQDYEKITVDGLSDHIMIDARSADAFGFIPDDPTKTAENDAAWVAWQAYLKTLFDASEGQITKKLVFGPGEYHFGDTLHAKYRTWICGTTAGFLGAWGGTRFITPAKKCVMVINRHNTLGPTVVEGESWSGADGSVIQGITFEQTQEGNLPFVPYAFGIWCKARAYIVDCKFEMFGNCAIAVAADSGDDDVFLGNANGTIIERCAFANSPAAAVWFWGGDANAGYTLGIDVVNCPFAIRDDSFLGNTHYSPQWNSMGFGTIEDWNVAPVVLRGVYQHILRRDGSGDDDNIIADAHINPPAGDGTHNDWWLCVGDDGEEDSDDGNQVTWGRVQDDDGLVYDAQPGQYANMWTTQPKTNATVWGSGSAPTPGVTYIQWAQASQMVNKTGDWANAPFNIGPYAFAGGYHAVGAWPAMFGAYQEGEAPCCHFPSQSAEASGGNVSFGPDTKFSLRVAKGVVLAPCEVADLPADAAVGTRGFVTDADVDYDSTVIGQAPVGGDNGECPVVKLTSGWVIG